MKRMNHPGWNPGVLREHREAHGLSLEGLGEALRGIAERHGLPPVAANFQTVSGHERGEIYPGPHYRRAYSLLFRRTESHLGFRNPLPAELDNGGGIALDAGSDGRAAITAALDQMVARDGTDPGLHSQLSERVGDAWAQARADLPADSGPVLVLVGGFAGSGKTELARFLSGITGWALLDKDQLTRPLVERLLTSLGLDPNDRHSPRYLEEVRPLEYRCLLETAYDNLVRGVSVVVAAPLLGELQHEEWLQRIAHKCETYQARVVPLWVTCDAESMRDYLSFRSAARDSWKLSNWQDYLAGLNLNMRPAGEHIVIDNTFGAAVGVADITKATLKARGGVR
jgi:predicted kinase